jgi:cyclohexanone monooxygenase
MTSVQTVDHAIIGAGFAGLASVEPRPDVTPSWNRSLQRRMKRTVWTTGGCQRWYLDAHGRNTTLWPRTTADFRRRLASFDPAAHEEVPA